MGNKIKLGTIIILGQIEKNQNFHEYLEELNQGITKLSNLDSYMPTEGILKRFPGIKPEFRDITVKIVQKGIGYIVKDNGVIRKGNERYGDSIVIKTKAYAQSIDPRVELKEIKDKDKLKKFFNLMNV